MPKGKASYFSEKLCYNAIVIIKAEAKLTSGKAIALKTRAELNQQAENLEAEIRQLEDKIKTEKKEAAKIEEIIENSG